MVIPPILNYVTADINHDVSVLSSNDSLFTNALTTESIRDGTAGLVYQDHCSCLLRLWQNSIKTTVEMADRNTAVLPLLKIFIQHITQAAAAIFPHRQLSSTAAAACSGLSSVRRQEFRSCHCITVNILRFSSVHPLRRLWLLCVVWVSVVLGCIFPISSYNGRYANNARCTLLTQEAPPVEHMQRCRHHWILRWCYCATITYRECGKNRDKRDYPTSIIWVPSSNRCTQLLHKATADCRRMAFPSPFPWSATICTD